MSDICSCNCNQLNQYDDVVEISPSYVYMMIPAEYVCIYHKLLVLFADYGVQMLDNCNASCKDANKSLINCFNMFNSAIAAKKLGNDKLATLLIKYIEEKLNVIYDNDAPCPDIIYPVDEKGKLLAMVGCAETPRFYIDIDTAKLIMLKPEDYKDIYMLGDNDYQCDCNSSLQGSEK